MDSTLDVASPDAMHGGETDIEGIGNLDKRFAFPKSEKTLESKTFGIGPSPTDPLPNETPCAATRFGYPSHGDTSCFMSFGLPNSLKLITEGRPFLNTVSDAVKLV